MEKRVNILGIDVGSVSVSIAGITLKETDYQATQMDDLKLNDSSKDSVLKLAEPDEVRTNNIEFENSDIENRRAEESIVCKGSVFHHGNIKQGLESALSGVDLSIFNYIAVTSSTPSTIKRSQVYDEQVAIIRAARHFHNKTGAILNVGGEKFSLSIFDESGKYCGSKNNTSCAAGTGSFLDQQSKRLGLSSPEELSKAAAENTLKIPDIATRCAVFAKTDLIHAQQEGFSVPQICDGLCKGLARNIYNTLFTHEKIVNPIIFCGGVSKNLSVKKHLDTLIQSDPTIDPMVCDSHSHLYGAIGAAFCMADDLAQVSCASKTPVDSNSSSKNNDNTDCMDHSAGTTIDGPYNIDVNNLIDTKIPDISINCVNDLLIEKEKTQKFFFPELTLKLSQYPDFIGFKSEVDGSVEKDIYEDPANIDSKNCYLGLDVGSTSTKSIIITETGMVVAGFYTRTASRPVQAVQAIFKSVDRFICDYDLDITIIGCGTTGSGRKLSAGIIGADLVLDEITAHSRAAYELDNNVDTIIEIGGQDAKFTTMKNGVVTSSFMNTVCAAGTGSFIEEQALKLGCPLSDYSTRTESVKSPISSDRCTVFMERDINHFLSEGYSVDEVLASSLHSVRDNYMTKVATEAKIGHTILFQGATAKNRALVAAFEQRLKKPVHVSRYCHLTGALGVALTLKDQHTEVAFTNESLNQNKSRFRGFDLWKKQIPVRQETCQLCTNSCKLTIAQMDQETVAFGFLCGRDYDTDHYVAKEKNFHLIKARKKAVTLPHPCKIRHPFTLGIPSALHMVEDLDFWKIFFNYLGIKTISSENMKSPVTRGRSLANAEFCTPVTSIHGHVDYLMEKADYVFLPYYFENKNREKKGRRQYCYYTQYVPSVIAALPGIKKEKLISPVVKDLYTNFYTKIELYRELQKIPGSDISFFDISSAHDKAIEWKKGAETELKAIFAEQKSVTSDNIDVLLVGRPYTILSESLNSRIPDIFSSLNVKTFFQDMLNFDNHDFTEIEPLLKEIHWEHAATILKATLIAARTKNLFPVYVTSFKCSPDSFGVDYFKKIMEAYDKPYLVLELDEHDSSVGYETRIEAAVRAFKNFSKHGKVRANVNFTHINPRLESNLDGKTIVMPNWDSITCSFLAATLRGEGYDAILMEETHDTIKQSLKTNTGQCIPLNAIASGYIQTIINKGLDPEKCVLWMSHSEISCNIKLYPHHIKSILTGSNQSNVSKNRIDKAGVYRGELSFNEISVGAALNAYFAYMFGGLLRALGCRLRPYEKIKGETDNAIKQAVRILNLAFEGRTTREDSLKIALSQFETIETIPRDNRPKVGIFGDFYVRDNDVMNQDLIHFIEEHGGEVVTTPYYRFAKMIAESYFKKWFKEGRYLSLISNKAILTTMTRMEKRYYRYFEPFFNEPDHTYTDDFKSVIANYGLLPEHTGESMDNILKIHYTMKENPDLALFVQTSPSFCCPGLVTEAMSAKVEKITGVPVVSITYDALGGNKNRVIIPFLQYQKDQEISGTKNLFLK